jgi:ferredoxin
MLQQVIDYARREFTIPEIDGESCVYALLDSASCRACVEVCPQGAWSLDDESLDIDAARCDGCGLCAPACPQGAIRHGYEPVRRRWKSRPLAFSACEQAPLPETAQTMPCLHALGVGDLLGLYRDGYRYLVQPRVDCDVCPRGAGPRLADTLGQMNLMLSSRGQPEMKLRVVPAEKWQEMLSSTDAPVVGPRLGRRGFLRHALGTGIEEGLKAAGVVQAEQDGFVPPGTLLARVSNGDVLPYVPMIDPLSCSGCDACVRLCPHGALALEENDDETHYAVQAQNCTGCGICVDVCDQGAISVQRWQAQRQWELPLSAKACSGCKVPFHVPVARSAGEECPVCAKATRYQDLYQFKD